MPSVLKNIEIVKNIVEQEIAAYDHYEKERKKEEKARAVAKLKEQQRQSRLSTSTSTADSYRSSLSSSSTAVVQDDDDQSFLETLAALQRLKVNRTDNFNNNSTTNATNRGGTVVTYPSIPERTVSLDYQSNMPGAFPSTPPPIPPKDYALANGVVARQQQPQAQAQQIEHRSRYATEGGISLRTTFLPSGLRAKFLQIAQNNTRRNLETCGILCGKLNRNAFFINYLVIPEQESTSDTCSTINEEVLFEFIDTNELFVLGWIHTHPTQTCFLSSVDLHTQNSYQIMLPEAVAIVCAPQQEPSWGVFRLTDPPGIDIIKKCRLSSTFHPHRELDLYKTAYDPGHIHIRDDLPFNTKDLRGIS